MQGIGFGILKIPEWILKFVYVNTLFVVFSVASLVLFGFFPALAAMFFIIRKWLEGETDIPVFKRFWYQFKCDFFKSNKLGYIVFITGLALFVYYELIQQLGGMTFFLLMNVWFMTTFIYILTALYIFPVFTYYANNILATIKTAFLTMVVSPLPTIMMISGLLIIFVVLFQLPGLVPITAASLIAFFLMWSAEIAFTHIQKRQRATILKAKEKEQKQI
ncbi:YesL family protein [Shouchella shacheensis]|uniref:YesL family protein n=1 Tax=Shouchella shacheensis TaxID=1649580 RepID=UPI000740039C|nr:DUF624 domain-containing protein [Shouchella shacheensis]